MMLSEPAMAVVRGRPATVTLVLASVCVLATMFTLVPHLHDLGNDASDPVVRLLTAPFMHGFSRGSMIPHLAANLLLLMYAGPRVERVLGRGRFAVLTGAGLAAYATIQLIGNFEVNGASVFIWAYGPPLAVLDAPRGRSRSEPIPTPTLVTLAVMWVIVPLLMTTVPYSFGWSGTLPGAFLVANTFHLSATAVGAVAAWIWRARLRGAPRSTEPRSAKTSALPRPPSR